MRSLIGLTLAIILLVLVLLFLWIAPPSINLDFFRAASPSSRGEQRSSPTPIHDWLGVYPLTSIDKYYSCISTRNVFDKEDMLCAVEQSVYLGELASKITRNSTSIYEKASRIQLWIAYHIKYVEDRAISGEREYVLSPIETLYMKKGDCEDKALLAVSLMLAAGLDNVAIVDIKLENTSIRHIEPAIIIDREIYIIPPINGTYPMSLLDYTSFVSEYLSRPIRARVYLLSSSGVEASWDIYFPEPAREQAVIDELYVKIIEDEARVQILSASGAKSCPPHVRSLLARAMKILPQEKIPIVYPLYMFYVDLLVYDREKDLWWPSLYGKLLAHQALANNLYTWLTRKNTLYCVDVGVEVDQSRITSYKYGVEGVLIPVVEERKIIVLYVVAVTHSLLEDGYYSRTGSSVVFSFAGSTELLEDIESVIIYSTVDSELVPIVGIVGNKSVYFVDMETLYADEWLIYPPNLLKVVVDRAELEEVLLGSKYTRREYLVVAWSREGYPLYAGFFNLGG